MISKEIRVSLFVSAEQQRQLEELLADHRGESDCPFSNWRDLASAIAQTGFNDRVAMRIATLNRQHNARMI